MERGDYEEYLRRFNARDYDGLFDFYADDPELSFFGITLRTREELKAFYGFLHDHVRENVILERFAASDDLVALEATVRIEGYKDLAREALDARGYGGLNPIRAGDVMEMRQMIHYHLRGGKFASVNCALI
jgi:ketosteroid isomerase-like protein